MNEINREWIEEREQNQNQWKENEIKEGRNEGMENNIKKQDEEN